MKLICLIFFVNAILFSVNIDAQVYPTPQKKAAPKQTISTASDSLKMAVNDAKKSFNTLFKSHRDTTTIMISDIDYEDSNLAILKDNLKKLKGVRSVSMQYKSNTAMIKIPYKGKSTDIWDNLPPYSKVPFKLIEESDNSITLKFKNDKNAK